MTGKQWTIVLIVWAIAWGGPRFMGVYWDRQRDDLRAQHAAEHEKRLDELTRDMRRQDLDYRLQVLETFRKARGI